MKQKIINFTGINRAVPQTTADDGSCQEIINLRPRKGCWRPIGSKLLERASNFTYNGTSIVFDQIYLHDIDNGLVAGKPNWIGYRKAFVDPVWTSDQTYARALEIGYSGTLADYINDLSMHDGNNADGTNLYACYIFQTSIGFTGTYAEWLGMDVIFAPSLYLIAENNTCTLIDALPFAEFDTKVVFLKQTMIVTTAEGLYVYLYNREKGYERLKTLPVPQVKLEKINKIQYSLDTTVTTAEALLGEYFNALKTHSQSDGSLFGSIMYIVCYRLFDGTYILPSVPQYFEINNVYLYNGVTSFWHLFNLYGLQAIINCADYPEELRVYEDIIDSVCIFSTKATTLYQIDESTLKQEVLERDYTTVSNYEGHGNLKKPNLPVSKEFRELAKSAGWYKIGEFPFAELIGVASYERQELDTRNFYQDYATRESLDTDQLSHHKQASKVLYVYNDRVHLANIKTIYGNPYVQWVQDESTKKEYDGYISVHLRTALGKVITQSSVKVPCYRKREPKFRDISMPIGGELTQEYITFLQTVTQTPLYVYGSIRSEEIARVNQDSVTTRFFWEEYMAIEEYEFWIPRIVGYNDARAYKMEIWVINNNEYVNLLSVSLQKNAEMNFAYYHSKSFNKVETDILSNFPIFIKPESGMAPSSFVVGGVATGYDTNRVQVSEIQNPLVYPANLSYQVGTGSIIGIMAGSEPLSTGQFGQFPLQVFTSKGIWAMEIGTGDVLYTNILPVNGEVANNANNLQAIGAGVVYTTDRGLSIVQGRQVVQLSEVLEGLPYTQITGKQEIQTLTGSDEHFTTGLSGALSDIDFLQYLQGSRVGYDHLNAELIVTNSAKGYSYLYGFESKTWYKINKSFSLLINNYPQLLGIAGPEILNLSKEADTGQVKTLIVSNSCSFQDINVHKRIVRAVMRCKFSTLSGKYGSFNVMGTDDLQTYQYLTGRQSTGTNVKDLLIQRSHGSCKFFVIIWNGEVSTNSELMHIDLIYKTKWDNRLR